MTGTTGTKGATRGASELQSLAAVRDALRRTLSDEAKFDFVAIRLMLRTGVNIKQPARRHVGHARTLKRVLAVIAALGIQIEGSSRHAE